MSARQTDNFPLDSYPHPFFLNNLQPKEAGEVISA